MDLNVPRSRLLPNITVVTLAASFNLTLRTTGQVTGERVTDNRQDVSGLASPADVRNRSRCILAYQSPSCQWNLRRPP